MITNYDKITQLEMNRLACSTVHLSIQGAHYMPVRDELTFKARQLRVAPRLLAVRLASSVRLLFCDAAAAAGPSESAVLRIRVILHV